MCRYFYGNGPWNELAAAWVERTPLEGANAATARLMEVSVPLLSQIVKLTLDSPMRSFAGRPLRALVQPERVSPAALGEMERTLGQALYTSMHWVWTESLRLLALSSLQVALQPKLSGEYLRQQEGWMLRLGGSLQAA